MQAQSDAQLLCAYAEGRDEAAFRELVTRYTDFVYSAAFRQVKSAAAAGDIAQSVFTDLARKPDALVRDRDASSPPSLAGWLHRATRFAALNHLRATRRRLTHERQAMEQLLTNSDPATDWEQIRPVLDEALDSLGDEDREALLLRYFKNQDFRAVGLALGVSDDTAQKRVSRAVERLRDFFSKRNVTVGASGLAVLISANAVQAAPVGLTSAISTAVLAETAATSTATITTKIIIMTTLQKTLVAAACIALAGTGIYGVFHLAKNHASIANSKSSNSTGDYVSREHFAFAGYATPEATINSLFWIQSKGDFKATLESASPRFHAILEQAMKAAPNGESTIVNSIIAESKHFLGYRIADVKNISDDKIVVSVLVDDARLKQIGVGDKGYNALMAKSQKQWQLIRINSEWKYDGAPDSPRQ